MGQDRPEDGVEHRIVEYRIAQYELEQGALEIQYIEEFFGEFPRKKTATEIVQRLKGRGHLILLAMAPLRAAVTPEEAANTVILDETGEKNLKIETVEAEETDFEETVFALGRIAEIPERHAVLSSRIAGRVTGLEAQEGDTVKADQVLVRVESRNPMELVIRVVNPQRANLS